MIELPKFFILGILFTLYLTFLSLESFFDHREEQISLLTHRSKRLRRLRKKYRLLQRLLVLPYTMYLATDADLEKFILVLVVFLVYGWIIKDGIINSLNGSPFFNISYGTPEPVKDIIQKTADVFFKLLKPKKIETQTFFTIIGTLIKITLLISILVIIGIYVKSIRF